MGVKRPFVEEEFQGPSFKHKQLDFNKNLTLNADEFPSGITSTRVDFAGEAKSNFCNLPYYEKLEDGETDSPYRADKELESSVPLSLVTSSSSEEDVGNYDTSLWSHFPEDIDFNIPRRAPQQLEDPYISLLNCPPGKEVPIGPAHQAEIPMWDPQIISNFDNESEQKELMGTCIIPLHDLNGSTIDEIRVGRGRTDCSCMDMGSMRCVQQHVKEARENLLETMGDEKFAKLGFYDMGDDDVACKWTPHDRHLFHEVVISNPVSHGRNFWKHLRVAFPNRTNKDIVSYYFNVFMLRKRAVQNRSYTLEIDSDDDDDDEENEGSQGDFYQIESHSSDLDTENDDDQRGHIRDYCVAEGEDGDSTVESLGDEDMDSSWMDDFCCDVPEKGSNGIYRISEGDIGKKLDVEPSFDP